MLGKTVIIKHDIPKSTIRKITNLIAIKKFNDLYFLSDGAMRWDDEGLLALLLIGIKKEESFDDMKYKMFPEDNFIMIKQQLLDDGVKIRVQRYNIGKVITKQKIYYKTK